MYTNGRRRRKNALGINYLLLYNKRDIAWILVNIVPHNISYCTRNLVQYDILLAKRLADSDLAVIGRTGIGPNTENIRIGLFFAVLTQWKFLYCIDRFDHIKATKSRLINNHQYSCNNPILWCFSTRQTKTV